ncbi:hypothetical protein D3C87_1764910 [compost metagenome]
MPGIRRDQRIVEVLHQRVVRCNQRGKGGDDQQQQNNPATDCRQRVARHFADKTGPTVQAAFDTLAAFTVSGSQRRIQRNGHDFVLGSKS